MILLVAAAGAAWLMWPNAALVGDSAALARVSLPGYAGAVRVHVEDAEGKPVPVQLRGRTVWPTGALPPGAPLTVDVAVRRPGWAGWLVGSTAHSTFHVRTPTAALRGNWLEVADGQPVVVSFSDPVHVVRLGTPGHEQTLTFIRPRSSVPLGVVAHGSRRAGSIAVSAAARSWERLPAPTLVSWFPALAHPQALVDPAPGLTVDPGRPLRITFSKPVAEVMGTSRPTIVPAVSGHWTLVDKHTLAFEPAGLGYPLGAHLHVRLPEKVTIVHPSADVTARVLSWEVTNGSLLRLQQLLAKAGYLPLDWNEGEPPATARTAAAELQATLEPPAGHFSWRYPNTPHELISLWRTGHWNQITRAAVMMFEHDHGLDVDGFYGPGSGMNSSPTRSRASEARRATAMSTFTVSCRSRSTSGTTDTSSSARRAIPVYPRRRPNSAASRSSSTSRSGR